MPVFFKSKQKWLKARFDHLMPLFMLSRRGQISSYNVVTILFFIVTCVSCFLTYGALRQMPPFGNDPDMVLWLLTIDLVLLLGFVGLIARRVVLLWSGRRRGIAGSHLHVRLVYIFSVMAAVPAVVMTVFSVYFFHYGIQTWFSERVNTAISESQAVARAYLEEHTQVIRADTLAMANDINRQSQMLYLKPEALDKVLETQSIFRNLSEAIVFDSNGRVLGRAGLTFSLEFEAIPDDALEKAREGEVAIMTGGRVDRVRALIQLDSFIDTYLFVGRMIDPRVLSHLSATEAASNDYSALQMRSSRLQVLVAMIFCIMALLLMFAAVWFGFVLARQLVDPISDLILASDRVRAGDFSTKLVERGQIEEFDYLAHAFNRMTDQIAAQQNSLLEVNTQLDRRRQFTEAVLAGASAGIVGVDPKGKITLANASAARLLGIDEERLVGLRIKTISLETSDLLDEAHNQPGKVTQAEVTISRDENVKRIFLVRIAIELVESRDVGAIITFDDITDLQVAQRKAAWSDVARRIAHEIKNPLTPIQLAAERLKRKYLKDIEKDKDAFEQCTDTIIRHVEDIGHMVDEFSAFARMPQPVMRKQNIIPVAEDVIFLQKQAHPKIDWRINFNHGALVMVDIDGKQIRQALTNLIQNAVDSLEIKYGSDLEKAWLAVDITNVGDKICVLVIRDNGSGMPEGGNLAQLTEPYVTHKEKGTGLGLAIVKKIMEDHGGELILSAHCNDPVIKAYGLSKISDEAACVVLTLPAMN